MLNVFLHTFAICCLITALVVPYTAESAERGYICVEQAAGGVKYNPNTKEWQPTTFSTGASFVLSGEALSKDVMGLKYVGHSFNAMICPKEFDENGFLRCEDFPYSLLFNRNSLRFQLVYLAGYVRDKIPLTEGGDTPAVTIGECAKF